MWRKAQKFVPVARKMTDRWEKYQKGEEKKELREVMKDRGIYLYL